MMGVLARNWWALALRGLFAVLFGITAFIWPSMTVVALVLLFGAYSLVDGIFALVAAFWAAEKHQRWWPLALSGLSGIAVGVLTFLWPGVTAIVLLYFIAAWAIITGVFTIVAAVRLRKEIANEWLLGISGALSVLVGVYLMVSPGAGALAVVWLIGAYAIAFGFLLLWLAFRLRARLQTAVPA